MWNQGIGLSLSPSVLNHMSWRNGVLDTPRETYISSFRDVLKICVVPVLIFVLAYA